MQGTKRQGMTFSRAAKPRKRCGALAPQGHLRGNVRVRGNTTVIEPLVVTRLRVEITSCSKLMMIRHSFVIAVAALILGSAFWITHLRVQEQERIGIGRAIFIFLVTLLGTSLLTVLFGALFIFAADSLAMAVMKPSLGRSVVVLYALIFGVPLGAIVAVTLMWRSSKPMWED